jgi:hypothetical protein
MMVMSFDLEKAVSFPFPSQMVCFATSVVSSRLILPRYFANAASASQLEEAGLEQHNITRQYDMNLNRNATSYCTEM